MPIFFSCSRVREMNDLVHDEMMVVVVVIDEIKGKKNDFY